jgi:cyclopropane-fatty-acyl-phospholipid synthase
MEQVDVQPQVEADLSWWQKRYKNIFLTYLKNITQGCVRVIQGAEVHVFGNEAASLTSDILVSDPEFYGKAIKGGSIGFAESYIDGDWRTSNLVDLLRVFAINQNESDKFEKLTSAFNKLSNKWFHFTNRNTKSQAKKNILDHYDLGNELYTRFLDTEMVYSSAVFESPEQSLEDAHLNKFKHICDALELSSEDHLVEIGTGWGGLAVYAAKNYGCKVTTTTISDAQFQYASDKVKQLGLEQQVTLLKKDYRLLTGQYDKLVSVEMIEAVGKEFFHEFFKQCEALVKPKGKMLIQAITIADQRFESYSNGVDFIQRYIFPGGCLPSITQLQQNLTKHTTMVTQNIMDIGIDYAWTLQHWTQRFLANWNDIKPHGYDEKFKRLWLFYFAYCEAAFLEKKVSTVHLLAAK